MSFFCVDDIAFSSNDLASINELKRRLRTQFDMKDLGVADVILGIKILKTPNGLELSQTHYIQKILEKLNCFNFKRAKSLLEIKVMRSQRVLEPSASIHWIYCQKLVFLHANRNKI